MKVNAIKCPVCEDVVYSRSRHDFRSCRCRGVSIDGGFDYIRLAWDAKRVPCPEPFELELPEKLTREALYIDWNLGTDAFGRIEGPHPIQKLAELMEDNDGSETAK